MKEVGMHMRRQFYGWLYTLVLLKRNNCVQYTRRRHTPTAYVMRVLNCRYILNSCSMWADRSISNTLGSALEKPFRQYHRMIFVAIFLTLDRIRYCLYIDVSEQCQKLIPNSK